MSIIQRVPWRVQPQGATRTVNSGFALNGALPNFNAATGGATTLTQAGTASSRVVTPSGVGLNTPNNGWVVASPAASWDGAFTIHAALRVNSIDNPWGGLFAKLTSGITSQVSVGRNSSNDYLYFGVNDSTSLSCTNISISSIVGKVVTLSFVYDGATTGYAYLNGVLANSGAIGTQNTGSGALVLGAARDQSTTYDSDVDWVLFDYSKGAKNGAEIFRSVGTTPWQLFAPQTRRIWVPVSAGGGTTISGALGTATASGHTGTVDANTTIAGALGTATATGLQGTVANSTDTTIAGALGTAVASGLQGGVNANRTIAGALGVAAASGLAGTVSNTNDTVINGALGAAVASGFTGTITWNRYIAGVLGIATAEGLAGTVRNGDAQQAIGGGGWLPKLKRRTKKEIDDERRRLGILPPEVVKEVAAAPVARRRITLQDLIGKTAAAQITNVDLSAAIAASKKRKQRRDDEFLLLM